MKRILKILAITLGGLILLLVALAIALPWLINPNDYKPQITEVVKTRTGRTLRLEGDIGLSVFPWVGLELGKTGLSNAPGFGKQPFLQVDKVAIKVKLLPLLRKQVWVDKVVLDGLELNLARDRKGRTNWDDLIEAAGAPAKKKSGAPGTAPPPTAAAIAFGVAGLDVRRGEIRWQDAMTGNDYRVRQLTVRTGDVSLAKPVDIHLGFDIESGKPAVKTRVALNGDVLFDPGTQRLQSKQMKLEAAGLALTANIDGKQMLDTPRFSGKLDLARFDVKQFLASLNLPAIRTADTNALSRASMSTRFEASTSHVALSTLKLTLDDSTVTGSASATFASLPAVRFDLALNGIDVDRYLPPAAPKGKARPRAVATPGTAALAIPVSLLRQLDAQGRFAIGKLKAFGIRSTDIEIPLQAKNGLIDIGPNKARLYQGQYSGKTKLDVRKGAPRFSINEKLTGIQIGPFLKDAGIFDKFSGQGDVRTTLTARGLDVDDILNTLNGNGSFQLKNGRIQGLNLYKMVQDAKAAYAKAQGQPVTTKAQVNEEMEYAHTSGSITVKNGLVTNNDLKMSGPYIDVRGQGSANLPRRSLDYRLNVKITEDRGKTGTEVPVRVYGKLTDPTYSIEWQKVLQKAAEQAVKQRVEEEKAKIKQDIEKHLQDELRKRLGL